MKFNCPSCGAEYDDLGLPLYEIDCIKCKTTFKTTRHGVAEEARPLTPSGTERIIVTATHTVEGQKIKKYLGFVSGEALMGANIVEDLFASITDIIGGRASAYEKEFKLARKIAIEEMTDEALRLGANAVVGVDLDYETVGATATMLLVSVTGTAVILE